MILRGVLVDNTDGVEVLYIGSVSFIGFLVKAKVLTAPSVVVLLLDFDFVIGLGNVAVVTVVVGVVVIVDGVAVVGAVVVVDNFVFVVVGVSGVCVGAAVVVVM